jgi:hypothetical protein
MYQSLQPCFGSFVFGLIIGVAYIMSQPLKDFPDSNRSIKRLNQWKHQVFYPLVVVVVAEANKYMHDEIIESILLNFKGLTLTVFVVTGK